MTQKVKTIWLDRLALDPSKYNSTCMQDARGCSAIGHLADMFGLPLTTPEGHPRAVLTNGECEKVGLTSSDENTIGMMRLSLGEVAKWIEENVEVGCE